MKHANIITKLTLEQKCALLSGETVFTTRGYKNAGIPSITLSDGPNGVRKQAGAADHLGLNPSVPATCFPTAATVACSWDPALGEQLGRAMGEEAAAPVLADTAAVSPAQGQTITINVYGAPGQDINKLADVIEARLSWKMERRKESFA